MALRHLVLLALLGVALATVVPRVRRNMVRGRPVHGLLQKPLVQHERSAGAAAIPTEYFTNKVDHFDATNTNTFKQRYWSNNQYYKPGGPVFFMLGGEAGEDPSWIESSTLEWTQLAQQHNAWLFLAEHRFYGGSYPTKDMTTPNMVYLSSAQALEDFATFIQGMNQKYPQLAGAKWVTFGGSYSGALAAWLRLKHPELVFAAVGSSGPVQAEVDFVEYLEVVEASIASTDPVCAASVTAGFNQVAQLLQTAQGRNTLKSTFNLCETPNPSNARQIETFWSTAYSPYMEIVQYSGDNAGVFRTKLTIANAICSFHDRNNTSIMDKMRLVNNYFDMALQNYGCNDINYNEFIRFLKGHSIEAESSDTRSWVWQTCTEFGYYQSTDSKTAGPWFGGLTNIPINYYTQQCTDVFGAAYNSASVAAAVAKTNAYYGGRDNFNSTQVLLPNGSYDPWHALGKLVSSQQTVVPVVITGTSHCADMYPADGADLQSLKDARTTIKNTLAAWLAPQ